MKARIAFVTTNLARGGAETQVALLASGLGRRGWDVHVISLLRPTAFERELASAGVPILSLGMPPGLPNPLGYARLLRILRDLRPQVVHSHMFHANLLARAARLISPVPVLISTLHSIAESSRGSSGVRRRDWLYRITDPLADLTVAVCEAAAKRHADARAVPRKKLRVIPNGVDTSAFRPDPARRERARQQLGIGQEFAWLAVGRLMWKKGYETMLRAFAGDNQGVLLVAGAGPQESELRELACEFGANARFLGEREDVADLMTACDGFVLSSVVEGLPLALLEAASSGLPCVAADAGGVSDIVLHERTGYVVPLGNPGALAEAMSRLVNMPAEARHKMGLAARGHVVARFDLGAVLSRWEQLYLELLQRWT
jgi:glycosyltransferase involved in cell wall biosynthesis